MQYIEPFEWTGRTYEDRIGEPEALQDAVGRIVMNFSDLADREAVRELTGRYCRAVARDDLAALLSLFTEDGSLETTFPLDSGQEHTATRGLAALRETYAGTVGMQLRPCVHNHVIELDGDRTRGFCSVEIRLLQDGEAYTSAGHYEDTFRREGGEWRFERRKLTLYHWVRHAEGWA